MDAYAAQATEDAGEFIEEAIAKLLISSQELWRQWDRSIHDKGRIVKKTVPGPKGGKRPPQITETTEGQCGNPRYMAEFRANMKMIAELRGVFSDDDDDENVFEEFRQEMEDSFEPPPPELTEDDSIFYLAPPAGLTLTSPFDLCKTRSEMLTQNMEFSDPHSKRSAKEKKQTKLLSRRIIATRGQCCRRPQPRRLPWARTIRSPPVTILWKENWKGSNHDNSKQHLPLLAAFFSSLYPGRYAGVGSNCGGEHIGNRPAANDPGAYRRTGPLS